jgi:hypothetical protein
MIVARVLSDSCLENMYFGGFQLHISVFDYESRKRT